MRSPSCAARCSAGLAKEILDRALRSSDLLRGPPPARCTGRPCQISRLLKVLQPPASVKFPVARSRRSSRSYTSSIYAKAPFQLHEAPVVVALSLVDLIASITGSVKEKDSIINVATGSKFATQKKAKPVISTINGVIIAADNHPSRLTVFEHSKRNIMVKIPMY